MAVAMTPSSVAGAGDVAVARIGGATMPERTSGGTRSTAAVIAGTFRSVRATGEGAYAAALIAGMTCVTRTNGDGWKATTRMGGATATSPGTGVGLLTAALIAIVELTVEKLTNTNSVGDGILTAARSGGSVMPAHQPVTYTGGGDVCGCESQGIRAASP
jgi:hypothetical protein